MAADRKNTDVELANVEPKNPQHKIEVESVADDHKESEKRYIFVNDPERNEEAHTLENNIITTSKYTAYNFVCKNLYEQYQRMANIYFTCCIFIQLIPGVQPFAIWISILPLVFILSVTAGKDAYEDWVRHKDDDKNNALETERLSLDKQDWEKCHARDIKVGDILRVKLDREVPADCICIGSSSPDGTAYINTASLDGENAPKSRRAVNDINIFMKTDLINNPELLCKVRATVKCKPNEKELDGFTGSFQIDEVPAGFEDKVKKDKLWGLDDNNFYYRGSIVSTVNYVCLLVLFVGDETKMMLNRGLVPFKFAQLERTLNLSVKGLLVFNVLFVLLISLIFFGWTTPTYITQQEDGTYEEGTESFDNWVILFLVQYVVFSFMVPLSLYVTIEMVKLGQSFWILWDRDMMIKQTFLKPDINGADFEYRNARCKNVALNEELGMVKYVFSDKTGTLTQNKMELSKIGIGDQIFVNDKLSTVDRTPETRDLSELIKNCVHLEDRFADDMELDTQCHFVRNLLLCNSVLPQTSTQEEEPEKMGENVRVLKRKSTKMAILVEDDLMRVTKLDNVQASHEHPDLPNVVYTSPSPDEIAFAEALQKQGVELQKRHQEGLDVKYGEDADDVITYEVRTQLGFTSARKRMSTISVFQDRYFLYTKGADDKVIEMLADDQKEEIETIKNTILDFAKEGCRTLLLAYREISEKEFLEFEVEIEKAIDDVDNRAESEERAFEELERGMQLLGCTAVDDQLQRGVPDCVESLKAAGIRLTVLTGDKKETAITIAKQANIVSPECFTSGNMHILDCPDELFEEGREEPLMKHLEKELTEILEGVVQKAAGDEIETAMIISGKSLEKCLFFPKFFDLMKLLSTIVCYRANPSQKAQVVETAKRELTGVCLAIGDGANDVSMIQESDVGVGIQGQEGSQAALSADFVIHRFRHLKRLLLVHGRYSYIRTSMVIVLSFYKNLCFIFPVAFFAFFNMASSQNIYEGALMSVFNVFWASLPPFIVGLFEKDIPIEACLEHPRAYREFVEYPWFNMSMFSTWMLCAFLQAFVNFIPCIQIVHENMGLWHSNGQAGDMFSFGNMLFFYAICVVNIRMVQEATFRNWILLLAGAIGPLSFLLGAYVYSIFVNLTDLNFFGTVGYITSAPHFWFAMPIVFFLSLFPSAIYDWHKRETDASLKTVLVEAYKFGYDVDKENNKRSTTQIVSEYMRRQTQTEI